MKYKPLFIEGQLQFSLFPLLALTGQMSKDVLCKRGRNKDTYEKNKTFCNEA